jgi:RNA polymerase sigma factor (sigma-70 family)
MFLQKVLMLERRTRPSRGEIDEAALALLARHGAQILATARRYAANAEDAEDAYQRGLEILLTKAPTTREEELVPWLKTVVKHEAFALRRQRERLTPVTGDGEPIERGTGAAATHEQAERYERLSQSAEALSRLKPQEIRCLVLRARGLSYREICETTGFTYTKVNRCLTEGRQALAGRLAGIEEGAECARLAPLLSALADGEADAATVARLRPHLKTCLSCRARLRAYRAAPSRVAVLVPGALMAARPDASHVEAVQHADAVVATVLRKIEAALGWAHQKVEAALAATQHKVVGLGERAQTAAELVTGQKAAALAASAAALAGGGTAIDQLANHHGPPRPAAAIERQAAEPPVDEQPAAAPSVSAPPMTTPLPTSEEPTAPAPAESSPPPPDPANEFDAAALPAPPNAGPAAVEPVREPSRSSSPPVSPSPASSHPQQKAARTGGEFAP